jgi:membrane-associated phospholipid phosphatase
MEYNRRLGLLAFGYAALITASSVYLAWHYAIDGYASIVLATAIFFVVKLAMQRGLPHKEASRTGAMEWPTGNTGDAHNFLNATSSTK